LEETSVDSFMSFVRTAKTYKILIVIIFTLLLPCTKKSYQSSKLLARDFFCQPFQKVEISG